MSKTDVISISDIHIGDNTVACWYNNTFHEGYLKRILEYVVSNKDDIKEFIILGDLFDFWTYVPSIKPPTVEDIINANPQIFAKGEILDTVVSALEGKVSYVVGNHDISVTQSDLDKIPLSNGYKITKQDDKYTIGKSLFTHGHIYTIFNAPDPKNPIPIGHFVTRMIAYYVANQNPVVPAWKMTGNGAPASRNILSSAAFLPALKFLIKIFAPGYPYGPDTVSDFIDIWVNVSGFKDAQDKTFKMADGSTMTIPDIKDNYKELFTDWEAAYSKEYVRKSIYTDGMARSMSWFTQQGGLQTAVDLVVTGHTHWPTNGVNALVEDVNCGFECFPEPAKNTERYTFAEIKNVDTNPVSTIYQITQSPSGAYVVNPATGIPKGDINFKPLTVGPLEPKDYSCYVRVINNSGNILTPSGITASYGKWVIQPPTINANSINGFWIQDSLGTAGSEGSVTYSYGSDSFKLHFYCPTLIGNNTVEVTGSASSHVSYKTKVGNGSWKTGNIDKGHPMSIEFTVS